MAGMSTRDAGPMAARLSRLIKRRAETVKGVSTGLQNSCFNVIGPEPAKLTDRG